jgi:hypothetical protein
MNGAVGATWLDGITGNASDPCYFGRVCQVDATTDPPTLTYCNSNTWGNCSYLKQSATTFAYGYNVTGNTTSFTREIMLEQVPGTTDEIAVTVRIHWTKGIMHFEFKVKTHLFNWI